MANLEIHEAFFVRKCPKCFTKHAPIRECEDTPMEKLSKETCLDIANYSRNLIKEALKNNTFNPTSVYEAPEMADMRIDRVVGMIVNYALNKAEEEHG
jgi:hypothetical protein